MSQHDMVISNADGATVRADVNGALQALASTSKGNARPSTVYAGQIWLDDNAPSATVWTAYLYDGADDIPIGTFDTVTNIFTPTGAAMTAVANVFTADQTLRSTNAGATQGPNLTLDRNSASPAVNDVIGAVVLSGRSSTGVTRTYAQIVGFILSPTNGSEDAQVFHQAMVAGTLTTVATIGNGSTFVGASSSPLTANLTGIDGAIVALTPSPTIRSAAPTGRRSNPGRKLVFRCRARS